MDFITDFFRLDLKKKVFVLAAIGAWWLSIQFSKAGFALESQELAWVGWALAILVTVGELAFNDRQVKPTLTIIFFGLIAYSYGIYTNVAGFWAARHPGVPFDWNSTQTIMSWVVGSILEIAPEPLLLLAYGRAREADPIGGLAELFSGKLTQSQGNQGKQKHDNRNEPFRAYSQDDPITEPKINTTELFKTHRVDKSKSSNPRWKH